MLIENPAQKSDPPDDDLYTWIYVGRFSERGEGKCGVEGSAGGFVAYGLGDGGPKMYERGLINWLRFAPIEPLRQIFSIGNEVAVRFGEWDVVVFINEVGGVSQSLGECGAF